MRSVKTKVIVLVLGCIILSSVATGGASILNSKKVVTRDSAEIMNLICADSANQINVLLSNIEQSVNTLSVYTLDSLHDISRFKSEGEYVKQYSENLLRVAINAAKNTQGACTVYIHYNPEFTDPESGIFCGKDEERAEFVALAPTNLSIYDPTDTEHVGWFYEPAKNKKGTWMKPYFNKNIQLEMISYVVPFYIEDELIGVVGMDIDFAIIQDIAADMKVYDTGYAFLTDNEANIAYHKDLARGTNLKQYNRAEFWKMAETIQANESSGEKLIEYLYMKDEKKAAFRSLVNDMRLVLTAPTSEIDKQANELIIQIAISILLVIALGVIVAIIFTRRMVRPLIELNEAAKKIAAGDLKVSITYKSKDEVGTLAESFRQTAVHLQKYISYINELAYRDSLTGVKNKTAYSEIVEKMDEEIRLKRPQFAVVVFDVNGLKRINDTLGHDFGDILIMNSSKLICKVFKRSPVYRIGGDEFVVLLENHDYDYYQELLEHFEIETNEFNRSTLNELKISIARGIALYAEGTDLSFIDVFKRADNAMYCNKAEMKTREQH